MTAAAAGRPVALRSGADAADAPGVWTLQRAPLGAARAVLLACALTVAAFVPVFVRPPGVTVAVFWPAAGIALVALVLTPRRHWVRVCALVLAATATGNVLAGRDPGAALLFGSANTLEALVTATTFLRLGNRRYLLERLSDAWNLVLAALLGGLSGGLVAALTARFVLDGDLLTSWGTFLASHPAGILMVAPVLLMRPGPPSRVSSLERALHYTALVGAVAAAYWPHGLPLGFLPLPVLAWAAARFGSRTAAAEMLLVGSAATVATVYGVGPFGASASAPVTTSTLQAYLLSLGVIIAVLGLTVDDVRRKAHVLAAGEQLFRRTFDEAMLGMLLLQVPTGDAAAQVRRCNPAAADMLDHPAEEVVGHPLERLLHPDSAAVYTGALDRVLAGELGTWHGELRLAGADAAQSDGPSRERRVAVTLSPLRGSDGEVERVTLQMQDVTARHHAEARLIEMALHDALTGLPNRTLLRDRLGEGLSPAGADGSGEGRLALLFCDLDDFKLVNDSAGHRVGDALLVEVARRLGALRPDDTVARLGGDEFVILSPVGPGDAHAYTDDLAALVLEMLTAPVEVAGARYRLSASIGITLSRPGSTPESLLREADSAMYQAKRTGKNRSAWFTEEHHLQARRQLELAQELRTGLERGEFVLHVQPVVDLAAGRVVAGEALVRWNHPQRGLLAPGEWLDVAEATDVIHALGSWVIDESCRLAARWREELGDGAPVVHANVSARQLGQGTLVADVRTALARHGLPGTGLVLELTETQLDHAHAAVLSELVQLRAVGVGLAADDFGTGYSSLTRLTEMPVDAIKIDRAFVARMHDDDRARAVVSSLVTMGAALDVAVVAEGVETREQARSLARMGCHLAQGYWWSRPVPDEEFVAFVGGRVAAVAAG